MEGIVAARDVHVAFDAEALAEGVPDDPIFVRRCLPPANYDGRMVWKLLAVAIADLGEAHAFVLAEYTALVVPHSWWSQPVSDHSAISQQFLLNRLLGRVLQFVGLGHAGHRLALGEVATGDALSPCLILCALLCHNAAILH